MITIPGRQYICWNFGSYEFCCVETGLSWYYTAEGNDYPETGGTAQIVSRLVSGLVDSVTMTDPARGTFTNDQLTVANGEKVSIEDCRTIAEHDNPLDPGGQWCYIFCEDITSQADCISYGCYWYRGFCFSEDQPSICYWTDAHGGATGLTITSVFQIIDSYLFTTPPPGYDFVPTLTNIMGIIDYYLGFTDSGNTKTGCDYIATPP